MKLNWLRFELQEERSINILAFIRILVVEDHAAWQKCIREKLRGNSCLKVIGVASDGLEAVLKAAELQPDQILLDIGLPKLNGIEAARQIRKVSPGSKIIFLTQEIHPDVAKAVLDEGGHGYVVKSDAESELLPAVEAVMLGQKFVSARFRDSAIWTVNCGLSAHNPLPAALAQSLSDQESFPEWFALNSETIFETGLGDISGVTWIGKSRQSVAWAVFSILLYLIEMASLGVCWRVRAFWSNRLKRPRQHGRMVSAVECVLFSIIFQLREILL
jgi:DNA-binding NarL/FixJ family response regulator